MITITANTRQATVTNKELLTSGSAGIEVKFTLSEDYDGLETIAVFRAGDASDATKVDVVLDSSLECVVPSETLEDEGEVLFIGVYAANSGGTVIIPTVWASAGVVKPGTEPNTPADAEPTPSIWAQILSVAEDAEAAAGSAVTIAERTEDKIDDMTVSASTLAAGSTATVTKTESSGIINLAFGIPNGDDGDDGVSPTVTVASITGGHSVTITDATHPSGQSFNVMDGEDAVVDATLTQQGEAADAKKTGDEISGLKNTLGQILTGKTTTSGVNDTYDFTITVGKKYIFGVPNADTDNASISFSTRNASGGWLEDGVSVDKGTPYRVFEPTKNAVKIRIFSSRPGQWIINEVDDTLSYRVLQTERDIQADEAELVKKIGVHDYLITDASDLSDANNAEAGVIYQIKWDASSHPANLPELPFVAYTSQLFLITLQSKYSNTPTSAIRNQLLIDDQLNPLYARNANVSNGTYTYSSWRNAAPLTVTVGTNGDFQTIYEACQFAYALKNVTIEVMAGEYDLIDEIGDDLTTTFAGIYIGNGMTINFHSGSKVVCEYDNSSPTIADTFSAFMAGHGDFEINGLNISAKNARYCVHDEIGGESSFVRHTYKNCNMYIDNSETSGSLHTTQCIGGGLGKYGLMLVENCVFNSECENDSPVVSWHNTSHFNDAKSKVVIKDNYFKKGTIRAGYFGSSPAHSTDFIVTNNSVTAAPYKIAENAQAQTDNIDFYSWDNEVRN